MRYVFAFWLLIVASIVLPVRALANEPVQFARDVLPILSANCFACHGPDEHERQAGLRLDLEADAKALREGTAAITPGNIELSSIVERMTSDDPDLVMPPPTANRTPTSGSTTSGPSASRWPAPRTSVPGPTAR